LRARGGAIISPISTSFSVTRPVTGDFSVASLNPFSKRRDLRRDHVNAGAGGVDFLGPGAGAELCQRLVGGLDAAFRLGDTIPRHVAPRRRIIPLLARSGIVLEQRVEALEILLGRLQLRSCRGDFRARGVDLRLRLPNVFDSRSSLYEPQLRRSGRLLRLCAIDRQLCVSRVEREHDLPRLHAIAFLHRQREDPSAGFWSESCFRRFNVSRHAQPIARRLLRTTDCEQGKSKD
jgi:hypothetical protein